MARRSKRLALSLAVLSAMAAQIATAVYVSSRNAAERNDDASMILLDDVVRASQAEVAAERMVSMSRAYLLTLEPELLARAHGAEAKLQEALQGLARRATALREGPLFEPVLVSANRYAELFQGFVTDSATSGTPQAVADSLRKRLIPARDRLEADLEELIARRQQQVADLHASTRDLSQRAVPLMVGICVFGLIASIMLVRLATASPGHQGQSAGVELHPDRPISVSPSLYRQITGGPRVVQISRPLSERPRRR
jgi:hypothetical protein